MDYAYLLGYRAPALERLTCLIVPAEGGPSLVVPHLEESLARHELGDLAGDLVIVPKEADTGAGEQVRLSTLGVR